MRCVVCGGPTPGPGYFCCSSKCENTGRDRAIRDYFVVGFAFTRDYSKVLLVKKEKPRWQRGKLNGIGGKVEIGELPENAMERECFEETGLKLTWIHQGNMTGKNNDGRLFNCAIFYAYDDSIHNYEQKEQEELGLYDPMIVNNPDFQIIDNLEFLVPFGITDQIMAPFIILEYPED